MFLPNIRVNRDFNEKIALKAEIADISCMEICLLESITLQTELP